MDEKERDLIKRCKGGSKEAFGELVLSQQKRVFNLGFRLLNNYDEAGLLAQRTFTAAHREINNFHHESSISHWLYRIAINLAKERFKAGPVSAQGKEEASPVIKLLPQMDSESRMALVLHDMEGLNYETVAKIEGLNIGMVRSRIHKAREILKGKLTGLGL